MRTLPSLALLSFVVVPSCSRPIYVLPPPEPGAAVVEVALPEDPEEVFRGARRAVLALFEALSSEDWAAALDLLTADTRSLLDAYHPDGAEAALRSSLLTSGGTTWRFDPVALLLLPHTVEIVDSVDGESEQETERRKEIFLRDAAGGLRRVVVLWESDEWRVHLPRIATDSLETVDE